MYILAEKMKFLRWSKNVSAAGLLISKD